MWYHGTPHRYAQPACPRQRDASCHWNALIGTHYTRNADTARRFQRGLHHGASAAGHLRTLPDLPGPALAFSNEYQLEDTVAACALRAGVFTGAELEELWEYEPGQINPALTLRDLEQDLSDPDLYEPGSDHGSRLIGDLRDFRVLPRDYDLRTAQVLAAITAFLVHLTAQGYTCVTYLNTHEDETDGEAEETAILPHVRQARGEILNAADLHTLFLAEHQQRLNALDRARRARLTFQELPCPPTRTPPASATQP